MLLRCNKVIVLLISLEMHGEKGKTALEFREVSISIIFALAWVFLTKFLFYGADSIDVEKITLLWS